ncbi:MAG: hypothetical protein IPH13_22250 [Planctomycetes bacterium]|nr:hypothetical protein [Planctomycetota bacterium]MCC7171748.1 hypothetical protein [Planctomycetota bacterium]
MPTRPTRVLSGCATITLVSLLAGATLDAGATQDPAPIGVDLSVRAPTDEPSMLTIRRSMKCEFTGASAALREPKSDVEELVLVDRFLPAQGQDAQRCQRTFVKWHATADGVIVDPPWNGVTSEFRDDASGSGFTLQDGFALPSPQLNELLRLGAKQSSVTIAVGGPSTLGATVSPDLAGYANLALCRSDLVEVSASKIEFTQLDAASKHATLTGSMQGTMKRERATGRVEAKFDLTMTLVLDTATHTLVRATLDGPLVLGGYIGGTTIEGKGEAHATIESGTPAAAKVALKSIPKPRVVHHEIDDHGLSLELPSNWAPRETKGNRHFLALNRPIGGEDVYVAIASVEEKTEDLDELSRWILDAERKKDKNASMKKVTTPLGKAIEYDSIEDGSKRGKNLRIHRAGKQFLIISLIGSAEGVKAAAADFQKARASLEALAR